jgi:hypothetical protein
MDREECNRIVADLEVIVQPPKQLFKKEYGRVLPDRGVAFNRDRRACNVSL